MKIWFSPDTISFYPDCLKANYMAAGSFPDDAVEVSEKVFTEFSGTAPEGKQRGVVNGQPCWVDVPVPVISLDEQKARARMFRDEFISSTDRLLVADYSIDDIQLSDNQRAELIAVRESFKKWPLMEGWPFIELPEVPQWLLIEAANNGYVVHTWPPHG